MFSASVQLKKFIELSSTPSLSQIGGHFALQFLVEARRENINYQSHDIIAAGTYRKGSRYILIFRVVLF